MWKEESVEAASTRQVWNLEEASAARRQCLGAEHAGQNRGWDGDRASRGNTRVASDRQVESAGAESAAKRERGSGKAQVRSGQGEIGCQVTCKEESPE